MHIFSLKIPLKYTENGVFLYKVMTILILNADKM